MRHAVGATFNIICTNIDAKHILLRISERPLQNRKIRKAQLLKEQVYENLRRAVSSGEFSPGERITEDRICKMLGVSRTPVREALHILGQKGGIEVREGGGYVFPSISLSQQQLDDIFVIRRLLEPCAVRLAAKFCTSADIKELKIIAQKEIALLDDPDSSKFYRANNEFRRKLFSLCENDRLVRTIETSVEIVGFMDSFQAAAAGSQVFRSVNFRKVVISGQEKVIAGLTRHDAPAVRRAWKTYLDQSYNTLTKELKQTKS